MNHSILIVDDEPNILMSLEFLMKKKGYQVFIARDGSEALNIIRDQKPNLILLDIMMPEVDGYEVCNFVKSTAALSHIKVVFLSAKTKEAEIKKGLDMGADMYLTKPFSNKILLTKIDELLNTNSN